MMREIEAPAGQPCIPWIEGMLPGQEPQEFAFPKPMRDWYMRVANWQCQTHIYTEKRGWAICGLTAEEVDHILPESYLLTRGIEDPNTTIGVPRCKYHHVGEGLMNGEPAPYGSPWWSKHPEIYKARQLYHVNPAAFKEAIQGHYTAAQQGEHYWNTTDEVDAFEKEHMMTLIERYLIEHPEDPRPDVHWHKKFVPKHWWDYLS